jgi:hypothetical protein
MRIMLAVVLALFATSAVAQTQPAAKPKQSTGSPDSKGQVQPQGSTGPINTGGGGAPAASPQGETPGNMQAAPQGSSKTTVEPK